MNRQVGLQVSPFSALAALLALACCLIALALAPPAHAVSATDGLGYESAGDSAEPAAYAFFFDNGLLCLKAGADRPGANIVSSKAEMKACYRWFDEDTQDPGTTIPWRKKLAKIKKVVIDASFSRFMPVSTEGWFAGCTALAEVEGVGFIDGARFTSVARMFEDCSSLKELDLSGFDASEATDCSGFLRNCSSLQFLNLGNLDLGKAKSCAGFFSGCSKIISLDMGGGWKNAPVGLAFPADVYQVSPSCKKFSAGSAIPSGAGEYRFSEMPMQSTKVVLEQSSYACTGKAIKPKPTVRFGNYVLRESVDYSLAYDDNIYPGTANLTIQGKGAFNGGLIVDFKIVPVISKAGDRVSYQDKTAKYTLKVKSVTKKDGRIVSADAAVVGIAVSSKKAKTLTIPSSCTVGGVKVTITVVSSKLVGDFRNVTSVVVGPKVAAIGARAFSKAKKVKSLIVKTARLTQAANCLKGSKVTKVQVKVTLSKAKRTKYQTWFTKKSGKAGVRYIYR